MLRWETLETATVNGSEFVLARRGSELVVRVGNQILMSTRMHDSERALAELALSRAAAAQEILIGGLGLGYTLREVLAASPATVRVTVAELVGPLVDWNRKYFSDAQPPLDDPRTRVEVGDVLDVLKQAKSQFDVVLLDVDNGPQAMAVSTNQRLYAPKGIAACRDALRPGGVLAVWSAGNCDPYVRRLRDGGFDVEVARVHARAGKRAKHVVFLAQRP